MIRASLSRPTKEKGISNLFTRQSPFLHNKHVHGNIVGNKGQLRLKSHCYSMLLEAFTFKVVNYFLINIGSGSSSSFYQKSNFQFYYQSPFKPEKVFLELNQTPTPSFNRVISLFLRPSTLPNRKTKAMSGHSKAAAHLNRSERSWIQACHAPDAPPCSWQTVLMATLNRFV